MTTNYSVEQVTKMFNETVIATFAATEDGQKHLNRIAKAITNESMVKRQESQRETLAEIAFNKQLGKVASQTPEKVAEFIGAKSIWIEKHIARKYGTDEE